MGSEVVQNRDRVRTVAEVFGPISRPRVGHSWRAPGSDDPLSHLFGRPSLSTESGVRPSRLPGSPGAVTLLPAQSSLCTALHDAQVRADKSHHADAHAHARPWRKGASSLIV